MKTDLKTLEKLVTAIAEKPSVINQKSCNSSSFNQKWKLASENLKSAIGQWETLSSEVEVDPTKSQSAQDLKLLFESLKIKLEEFSK